MTVEDLLEALASYYNVPPPNQGSMFNMLAGSMDNQPWAKRFVSNVVGHVRQERPLSTEQARIILRMANSIANQLVNKGLIHRSALQNLNIRPEYRLPPYPSANVQREVRYLGKNLVGFRSKYNDLLRERLKKLDAKAKITLNEPSYFVREHKMWVIQVTDETLEGVEDIIADIRFDFDEPLLEFLAKCHASKGETSIVAYDPELELMAANVCDNDILAWWMRDIAGGEEV